LDNRVSGAFLLFMGERWFVHRQHLLKHGTQVLGSNPLRLGFGE
jgi:hypothetical protein